MVNNENRGNPKTDLAYRKKKNAEDMRYQVISFGLMIGLTLVAFLTVASDAGVWFTVPFILLLPQLIGLLGVQLAQPAADLCTFAVTLPFLLSFLRRLKLWEQAERAVAEK